MVVCMFFMLNIATYAATKFIDCPDCNGGHSPSCVCGGKGEYFQNCDLCNGAGTLHCDLCNGSGTYGDENCNRCGGSGSRVCNRCNGNKKEVYTCKTPSCKRCGGTGRYPEGSPEHIKQLQDEGKLVPTSVTKQETTDKEEATDKQEAIDKNEATVESETTVEQETNVEQETAVEQGQTGEQQTGEQQTGEPETTVEQDTAVKQNTESMQNNTAQEPIIEVSQISKAISDEKEKKAIRVSTNISISLANSSAEEVEELQNMPTEELEEVIQKVDNIVKTAKPGTISEQSKLIVDKVAGDKDIQVNPINFAEHESLALDFPVEVRVAVNPEEYQGMEKGYAYHILTDQDTVEYLGEAELIRDEAGNVIEVAFVTRGFSDFIITSEPLEIIGEENLEDTAQEQTNNNAKNPAYLPAIILVGIILIIGIAGYVLKKRA